MNEQPRVLHVSQMVEAFQHFVGSAAAVTPGGCMGWHGTLLHIHIAEAASYEMEELKEAHCVAGRGIEGDRYFTGKGTYSKKADVREVTLIEQEVLDALAVTIPRCKADR